MDIQIGARPIVQFQGDIWSGNSDYERIKNLLLDFWVANITLTENGIDIQTQFSHMVVYACFEEGKIEQRVYRVLMNNLDDIDTQKSNSKVRFFVLQISHS